MPVGSVSSGILSSDDGVDDAGVREELAVVKC